MALIEVQDLVVGYGARVVVDRFSLVLDAGHGTLVDGPNGSGKTTLFRAIAGLLTPRSGDIRLEGRSLAPAGPEQRAALGLGSSLQGQRVFQNLTVSDNLKAALSPLSPANACTAYQSTLERFPPLARRWGARGRELNGGFRQLLAVAMALARIGFGLRLALLDEPSIGLDPESVCLVSTAIIDALAAGAALLIADHDRRLTSAASLPAVILNPWVQHSGET